VSGAGIDDKPSIWFNAFVVFLVAGKIKPVSHQSGACPINKRHRHLASALGRAGFGHRSTARARRTGGGRRARLPGRLSCVQPSTHGNSLFLTIPAIVVPASGSKVFLAIEMERHGDCALGNILVYLGAIKGHNVDAGNVPADAIVPSSALEITVTAKLEIIVIITCG